MKKIKISNTDLSASNIIMGCMRINALSKTDTEHLIRTAIEQGINYFDHADIYENGQCETHFSQSVSLTPSFREKIILQSKCGIRSGYYDFSKEYILQSVDASLSRLNTPYLDVLLLHRPDTLMEPSEIAEAFDILEKSGKVRYLGVSNQNSMQIEFLQKYCNQKLIINQMQLSIAHCPMIDNQLNVNMNNSESINRDGNILDYCRLKDITLQAWSPFQKGFFEGIFLDDYVHYEILNKLLDQLADKYQVSKIAIAVAFLTRHPANIQVILGTTNVQRLIAGCAGSDIPLSRQEWYAIYKASGKTLP